MGVGSGSKTNFLGSGRKWLAKDESPNIPLDPSRPLDKALKSLEEALGGREEIVAKLSLAPELSGEETTILNLLADPANRGKSLASLCGAAGTNLNRVLSMFQKGEWAEAYVKSIRRIARQLPDVVGDVMSRALPKWRSCAACEATGALPPKKEGDPARTCLECEGLGRVEVEPSVERQKMALEAGGLLKSGGGGSTISIDNRRQTVNAPVILVKSSPDFRTATDKLLYPGRVSHQLPQNSAPANFITEEMPSEVPVEAEIVKDSEKSGDVL